MKHFEINFKVFLFLFLIASSIFGNGLTEKGNNFERAGISKEQLSKLGIEIQNFIFSDTSIYIRTLKATPPSAGNPVIREINNTLFISAFIKSNNSQLTKTEIETRGGKVSNIIGEILVADLPVANLTEIVFNNSIIRAEAARYQESLLDTSLAFINADKVHSGENLPKYFKGQNVVVGVVDTGIDWTHPAFINENGNRILYLWDMSDDTNPPAEFEYGTEYTKEDLDQQNSNQIDNDGHGTHVASIAAGNYGGEDYPLVGVAPEADIVFVKVFKTRFSLSDNDIVNGCDYIFKRAEQLGKPAVINLSLGFGVGRNGTSLFEEALTNLIGPGKLIVASAGNNGSSNIHLQYQMSGSDFNSRTNTEWSVYDSTVSLARIEGYPESENFNFGLQVLDKEGNSKFITTSITSGEFNNQAIVIDGDTLATLYMSGDGYTNDPFYFSVLLLFRSESDADKYDYNLYTFGSAFFNAWIGNGEFNPNTDPDRNHIGGDNLMTIGAPSTAYNVFSVGAFATKLSWTDIDGTPYQAVGTITDRAYYSSIGPTRDGRIKPDFSAPGHWIAAGKSKDANYPRAWMINEKIAHSNGTSAAAPHFTGVIGLLLEQKPDLTYDEAFDILKNSAISDDITGEVPNNEFGHGRIDAHAALQLLITSLEDDNSIPVEYNMSQNYPNPFNPTTVIDYSIPSKSKVTLKVYDVLGKEVAKLVDEEKSSGAHKLEFDASNLSSGVYFYRLSSGDYKQTRKMMLIK